MPAVRPWRMPMCLSRRALLELAGATVVGAALPAEAAVLPAAIAALKPMTAGASPITLDEHKARLARAQALLGETGLDALAMPFVFASGIGEALPASRIVSGTPVSAGCRMLKDAHEIALMRRACEITVRAHRAVFASLREGMTQAQATALTREAHQRLGVTGGSLVLFGESAAFPHGTRKPRPLRPGDVVLIDGGGTLHGYASDITRTMVFGAKPTDRQRQ